jgi:hypothetical protein
MIFRNRDAVNKGSAFVQCFPLFWGIKKVAQRGEKKMCLKKFAQKTSSLANGAFLYHFERDLCFWDFRILYEQSTRAMIFKDH